MIEIKNLIKKYRDKKVLDISYFKIEKGQNLAIMGANGSGKTTLAEIIFGTKKKTKGEVIFDENQITKNAVFQESSYDAEINLWAIANFYKSLFKSNANLEQLFKNFELEEVKKIRYSRISGGQKQKFKFLICLLNQPKMLLLDELSTSLDYVWREKLTKLVLDYINNDEVTTILISHDIKEVATLCNRVIFLEKGQIIKDLALVQDFSKNYQLLQEVVKDEGNI